MKKEAKWGILPETCSIRGGSLFFFFLFPSESQTVWMEQSLKTSREVTKS